MPLIYITGPTGAGKTTVRNLLKQRGYEAHDTDEDDLSIHVDKRIGKQIEYPKDPSERTPEWHANHSFEMSEERISQLAADASRKLVFLCGAASNDLLLARYFSKVICLTIDEDQATSRIKARTTNHYGKVADELAVILSRHKSVMDKYQSFGATMIQSSGTAEEVVDRILSLVL